jgi:DNA/RNA-binding domain of Phe-tRNA-synthetase-like protein
MQTPFDVGFDLDGWALFWAHLEKTSDPDSRLARLRSKVGRRARETLQIETLSTQPTVSALRSLFRAAGCDPTRYRPSSEALIRRVLKGVEIPQISSLVDINNCLSVSLAVPCCVMTDDTLKPPFVLRTGSPGESYESLRGPFNLDSRPLLADRQGPCDAPITGNRRVMVTVETRSAWLVAYLPAGVVPFDRVEETLAGLLAQAPVAHVTATARFPRAD